jgi:hypothetical protein
MRFCGRAAVVLSNSRGVLPAIRQCATLSVAHRDDARGLCPGFASHDWPMAIEVAPKERLPIWSGKNIEAERGRHRSADIGGRDVVAAKMSSLGRTHQCHDGHAKRCCIHTRTSHSHCFPLILQRSGSTIAALSRGPQAMMRSGSELAEKGWLGSSAPGIMPLRVETAQLCHQLAAAVPSSCHQRA